MTDMKTTTTCGHFGCDARALRGLPCFNDLPAPKPMVRDWHSTYSAAVEAARLLGGRVVSRRSDGGPKRFFVVSR